MSSTKEAIKKLGSTNIKKFPPLPAGKTKYLQNELPWAFFQDPTNFPGLPRKLWRSGDNRGRGFKPNYRILHRNRAEAMYMKLDDYMKMSSSLRAKRFQQFLTDHLNDLRAEAEYRRDKRAISAKQMNYLKGILPSSDKLSNTGKKMMALDGYALRVAYGGARAGKTHAILQFLNEHCARFKKGMIWANRRCNTFLVYIGGVNFGMMEESLISEWQQIMEDAGYWNPKCWNKAKHSYSWPNGATTRFFSYDSRNTLPGLACHIYFFNEANDAPFAFFSQIRRRCLGFGWLDFNPTAHFWFNDEVIPRAQQWYVGVLRGLTYRDNNFLSQEQIDAIEGDMDGSEWEKVFIEGQFSEVSELVYNKWRILRRYRNPTTGEVGDPIPHEAKLLVRGLDWGGYAGKTTQSKMAIVALYQFRDGYLLDQEMYDERVDSSYVARFLKSRPVTVPIIADSNNPEGVAMIKQFGVTNIRVAEKGPGSIRAGIKFLDENQVWVTESSSELWKERNQYIWIKDKRNKFDPRMLPSPRSRQDLLDAARYGSEILRKGADGSNLTDELMMANRRNMLEYDDGYNSGDYTSNGGIFEINYGDY